MCLFCSGDQINIIVVNPDTHFDDVKTRDYLVDYDDEDAVQTIAHAKLNYVYGEPEFPAYEQLSNEIKMVCATFVSSLAIIDNLSLHVNDRFFEQQNAGEEAKLYNAGILPIDKLHRYTEHYIMLFTYPEGRHIPFWDAIGRAELQPDTVFFCSMLCMNFSGHSMNGRINNALNIGEDIQVRQRLAIARRDFSYRLEEFDRIAVEQGTGVHPIPYLSHSKYCSQEVLDSGAQELRALIDSNGYHDFIKLNHPTCSTARTTNPVESNIVGGDSAASDMDDSSIGDGHSINGGTTGGGDGHCINGGTSGGDSRSTIAGTTNPVESNIVGGDSAASDMDDSSVCEIEIEIETLSKEIQLLQQKKMEKQLNTANNQRIQSVEPQSNACVGNDQLINRFCFICRICLSSQFVHIIRFVCLFVSYIRYIRCFKSYKYFQ